MQNSMVFAYSVWPWVRWAFLRCTVARRSFGADRCGPGERAFFVDGIGFFVCFFCNMVTHRARERSLFVFFGEGQTERHGVGTAVELAGDETPNLMMFQF